MSPLPPCPHLPEPRAGLDWRALNAFREGQRGAEFYVACLEYGHALWQRGLVGRAILCLDRAFGAEIGPDDPVLGRWPLPYAPMAWFLRHAPRESFVGNPRVHFQHYADRMNEPRRELRQARAWACWALTRVIRPELPGDPKHVVTEPDEASIFAELTRLGHAAEAESWRREMARNRG